MSTTSWDQKKAGLRKKLAQLRSITSSTAVNKTSIIIDASKYIGELKGKVERLNKDIAAISQSSSSGRKPTQVSVETLENGYLINVFSEYSCPGLLVSVLEAFDELGLDLQDANVSCSDSFRLQAVGGDQNQGQDDCVDAQVIKQAVLEAIRKLQ